VNCEEGKTLLFSIPTNLIGDFFLDNNLTTGAQEWAENLRVFL